MHTVPMPMSAVRRGEGFPLLLVHGSGVDHRILLPLDHVFDSASAWGRIYLDLPGFGSNPALPDPGGLDNLADWLDVAVDTLIGDRPFAVVGNSLGGLLARELAARRKGQVAAIALFAPVVYPERHRRNLPPREVLEVDHELICSLAPKELTEFREVAVLQTAESWERFKVAALPGMRDTDQRAVARLESRYTIKGESPEERMGSLWGPSLIVAGRQDHIVGFADQIELSRSYDKCTLAVLDRAGHNVHLEQPNSVEALLDAWQHDALDALAVMDNTSEI